MNFMITDSRKLLIFLLPLGLAACALPYDAHQNMERQKCLNNPNTEEMRECMNRKPVSYDDYMKRRDALNPGSAETPSKPFSAEKPAMEPSKRNGPTCFTNATTGNRVCVD